MIEARDLRLVRSGRALIDGVSVRFEPGRMNLVLGPNGAGKSTLLRLLDGQLKPDAGSVRYGDSELGTLSLQRLARIRAVLSQNVEIAFPLRVREVVMMGRYPHFAGRPAKRDEDAVDEVMALFDVAQMADRDFLTLSGGEQQRVHFARVLAQIWRLEQRHYLFLDEPLTFLDIEHQLALLKTLRELLAKQDLVVVGVVHDLNLAAHFADHLVLLHDGKLLAQGPRDAVLTRENIEKAFRVTPRLVRSESGGVWFAFE